MAASIYDVAKRAGVSISTVSRILNNSAGVSDKKRKAVMEAVEYYQYEPNQFARGLVTQTTNMIGVYIPVYGQRMSVFDGDYNLELFKGIEETLNENDYSMVLICENRQRPESAVPKYLEYMKQKRIDGLIMSSLGNLKGRRADEDAFNEILEEGYPMVYIGKKVHKKGVNVYAQFERYTMRMLDILRENGHTGILLYYQDVHQQYIEGILNKYRKLYPQLSLYPRLLTANNIYDEAFAGRDIRKYYMEKGVTAVCTIGMEHTQVFLNCCAKMDIKIPDQLSIISVEHKENQGSLLYPKISAFHVPARQMGRGAAKILLENIKMPTMASASMEYESVFCRRDSIRHL